jgi:hypothetical protein
MTELQGVSNIVRRLRASLDEAVANAKALGAPMGELAGPDIFKAAAARDQINATLASLTAELAAELQALAKRHGWHEVTTLRLKELEPTVARDIEAALSDVRQRAATLRDIDGVNRIRGTRALSWLRTVTAAHTGRPSIYDRRGSTTSNAPLSTASRTV